MSNVFLDTQLTPSATTEELPRIEFFRTTRLLETTALVGEPTPAAQEVLGSGYWSARVLQGLVESSAGRRISLDDYLSNPG